MLILAIIGSQLTVAFAEEPDIDSEILEESAAELADEYVEEDLLSSGTGEAAAAIGAQTEDDISGIVLEDDLIEDLFTDEELQDDFWPDGETEAQTLTEPVTGAEPVAGTETEAEQQTDAETETEQQTDAETETEEPLIEPETENGTENEADLAAVEYNLWIDGIQVTSANKHDPTADQSFYYDNDKKILAVYKSYTATSNAEVIKSDIEGLTINISSTEDVVLTSLDDDAIQSNKDLTIRSSRNLTLKTENKNYCGIFFLGTTLTIENVTLSVDAGWGISGPAPANDCVLLVKNAEINAVSTLGAVADFGGGITLDCCEITSPAGADFSGKDIRDSAGNIAKNVEIKRGVKYPLWVGGVQVNSVNKNDILGDGGKAKFDPDNVVLTLNNPTLTGAHTFDSTYYIQQASIDYNSSETKPLTIKGSLTHTSHDYELIRSTQDLILDGNFTLKKLKNLTGSTEAGMVVHAHKSLTVDGGIIQAELEGGTQYRYGLAAFDGSLTVNAGQISITNGSLYNAGSGNLLINGGTISIQNGRIYTEKSDIEINHATITGNGGIIAGYSNYRKVNITDSNVQAAGIGAEGKITITGSEIVSHGDPNSDVSVYQNGIRSAGSEIRLENSKVTCSGRVGISADTEINVINTDIQAKGVRPAGEPNFWSPAIICEKGSLAVSGNSGSITAEGADAAILVHGNIALTDHYYLTPKNASVGGFTESSSFNSVNTGGQTAKKVVIVPGTVLADYTEVNAALAKIPANLSNYTDATAKAVTDAKKAVVTGLPISQQAKVDAMAKAINDALKKLVLKGADYSKVDAALKKIPSNLSLYTDATAKKVTDAKNAVKRGYNITQQAAVNAMATAIENAIKGLVFKPADYSKVDAALKKIPADLRIYTDDSAKKVTTAKAAVKRGYNMSRQAEVNAMATAIENAVKGLKKKTVKLIAAYNGAHGVGVKWIKLAGATEYTIWQKYNGTWRSIKTVKPDDKTLENVANTLMYTDQTVKTGYGKGYIYSVSAKIGSLYIDYDKAGVAIYRLNPPILTKAVSKKAGAATVSWKGVFGKTETNGAYDLQYITEADSKAGKWTWQSVPQKLGNTTTSTTVTGLKKGVKYIFRIRCSKTNKDRGTFYSEYSPWISVTVKK